MVKTKKKAPRRGKSTIKKTTTNTSGRATSSNGKLKTNGRAARAKTNKVQPPKTKTQASPKPSTKGNSKAKTKTSKQGTAKLKAKISQGTAKSISREKTSAIHRLLVSLKLVSNKKKKEQKYDSYYPGQLRPVNNAETRGHIGYTVTKKGTGKDAELGYVSITHSDKTQGKANEPLKINPNPKDTDKSFAVNKPKQEKAKKMGNKLKGWRLNKHDKKTIKKIYHKK